MAQRQRRDEGLMTGRRDPASSSSGLPRARQNAARQNCITFLAGHPEDGVFMVGTGGVRTSRWGLGSRGRRAGATNGTICRSATDMVCNKS